MSWWQRTRDRRRAARVKPGDGSALKPYRWWQPLVRSLFTVDLRDHDGVSSTYAVDVHLLGTDDSGDIVAQLYRDGRQSAVSRVPAAFPVPGGRIEVEATMYGLKRMHVVQDEPGFHWAETPGEARMLTPHPRSAEGLRAGFGERHPLASRIISVAAVVILLVSLAVASLALVEMVTRWELVAPHVDPFVSPVDLPGWATTTLFFAGLVAAIERAITLRNHWLIDADTSMVGT
ncbi:hypothetical protein [Demequina sp.]|uniref:hypothetical protein n=1 Tax=Demequina sp. TaxID=2050685 RepID=UPI003A89463F